MAVIASCIGVEVAGRRIGAAIREDARSDIDGENLVIVACDGVGTTYAACNVATAIVDGRCGIVVASSHIGASGTSGVFTRTVVTQC